MSTERRLDRIASTSSNIVAAAAPVRRPEHIVDFAVHFLGVRLFPRQALVLKLVTLATDLLTAYDHEVLGLWMAGFRQVTDGDRVLWEGSYGTPGDLMERIETQRSRGAPWFNELLAVFGRRGSKGFLGSILIAWRVWTILMMDDPQGHFAAAEGKALGIYVFGTRAEQARRDQFGDAEHLITTSACFAPYLGKCTKGLVTVLTKAQVLAGAKPGTTRGLIEIRAAETTLTAGRGPTMVMLALDEFGHVLGAGSTADSTAIYTSATPALAQCGPEKLTLQTSSPWGKTGQLYLSYTQATDCNPDTGSSRRPSTLVLQLPSWDVYLDWAQAPTIPMWPDGPMFEALSRPIISDTDEDIAELARTNVDSYAVEFLGHFRSAQNAYLAHQVVKDIFSTWQGRTLAMGHLGRLGIHYVAHVDPSVSGANTAVAVAHLEDGDDGQQHVIYDHLGVWQPSQFPNGRISYTTIEDELFELFTRFNVEHASFDQFNSAGLIEHLQTRLDDARLPKPCKVFERTSTQAWNWQATEIFKTAAGQGIIHAPYHDLARLELEYLQYTSSNRVCAPTSGPVLTDDIADSMIAANYTLLKERAPELFAKLANFSLVGTRPGPGSLPTTSRWPGIEQHSQDEIFDLLGASSRVNPHAERRGGDHRGPARGRRFNQGRGPNF